MGSGEKGAGGRYKWDEAQQRFVRVSSRASLPASVGFTGPQFYQHLGDDAHPNGRYIKSRTEFREVMKEQGVREAG